MSLTGDVAGVVSGLLNGGQSIPTPNLKQLFETIRTAGDQQKNMIGNLPEALKPLYAQYVSSTSDAGQTLQSGTAKLGQNLLDQTKANYGPEATQAALDAAKTSIYADVPGQQDAIREALAASGGFDRGTAAKQLAAPVLQAGARYAQSAANITADQLKVKQQAQQQALNTITNMNDQALQSVFGMTKEQATAILNGNRQDLKDQLTQLINQSQTETNQSLDIQGATAMNDYKKNVAENARTAALNNSFTNLGVDALSSVAGNSGFFSALDANPASAGYDPNEATV